MFSVLERVWQYSDFWSLTQIFSLQLCVFFICVMIMIAVCFCILWKCGWAYASAQQKIQAAAWFWSSVLAVSLSFTGDVSIPVTLPSPTFRLDSLFICFLMWNKAAFVLCDVLQSIYSVCSWTFQRLCDLCLSDRLYYFVKYFNKIKLFFTTHVGIFLIFLGQERLVSAMWGDNSYFLYIIYSYICWMNPHMGTRTKNQNLKIN